MKHREQRQAPKLVAIAGRSPPSDLDAEAAVLSAIILDPARLDSVLHILPKPEMFFSWANQRIYESLLEIDQARQRIDSIALASRLQAKDQLHEVGGAAYIIQILDATPVVAHADDHARIVRDLHSRRLLVLECQRLVAEGYGDVPNVPEWMSNAAQRVAQIADNNTERTDDSLAAHLQTAWRELEAAQQHGRATNRVATGHTQLDVVLSGGYAPSTLTVLAARPGMGKTSLAMQHALACARAGLDTLVFSLEMPADQIALRINCTDASVNSQLVQVGRCPTHDYQSLAASASNMSKLRLWIDDRGTITTAEIRSRVRRQQRDAITAGRELGLVVVDYLQLVTGRGDSREQEISSISRDLKAIAKEFQVAVLALSQLSRSVESRADKRPLLSDLRESGAIEQDADNVIFIYREDYYSTGDDKPKTHMAEVIVAKHRAGSTGKVPLRWTGHSTRFDNLDPSDHP